VPEQLLHGPDVGPVIEMWVAHECLRTWREPGTETGTVCGDGPRTPWTAQAPTRVQKDGPRRRRAPGAARPRATTRHRAARQADRWARRSCSPARAHLRRIDVAERQTHEPEMRSPPTKSRGTPDRTDVAVAHDRARTRVISTSALGSRRAAARLTPSVGSFPRAALVDEEPMREHTATRAATEAGTCRRSQERHVPRPRAAHPLDGLRVRNATYAARSRRWRSMCRRPRSTASHDGNSSIGREISD
jgi:hypothetical protein